ncbi:MAG: maltose acetyltransferase domain-containing protein [Geminicoccaceae bacterium]
MTRSELEKMRAGEWYSCIDPELERLRFLAREAVHEHNGLHPFERGGIGPALGALLGSCGRGDFVEAPFHCAYGRHIFLGDWVYLNAGCTIFWTRLPSASAEGRCWGRAFRSIAPTTIGICRREHVVRRSRGPSTSARMSGSAVPPLFFRASA